MKTVEVDVVRRFGMVVAVAVAGAGMAAGCSGGDGGGGGGVRAAVGAGIARSASGGEFEAFAVFPAGSIPIDEEDVQVPDGTCRTSPLAQINVIEFRDAGPQLTLSGPAGDMPLDVFFFEGFYAGTESADFFTHGATYTLSAPGGARIDAFSQAFTMSGDFTLTDPPESTASMTLDRAQDFTIAWTSTGSADPILVVFDQYDADLNTLAYVSCRFTDDGSATVPSSALQELTASSPGVTTVIEVSKQRYQFIDIDAVGMTAFAGQASWAVEDVTVQ